MDPVRELSSEYSTKLFLKSKSRKCDQVLLDNTEDKKTRMVQKCIEEILTQTQLCQIFH